MAPQQYSSLPSHDDDGSREPTSSTSHSLSQPRNRSLLSRLPIAIDDKATSRLSRVAVWFIGGWLIVVVGLSILRPSSSSRTDSAADESSLSSVWATSASSATHWSIEIADTSPLRKNPPALDRETQRKLHLPQATCQREFPLLYQQLADNVQWWKSKGGIKAEQVDAAFERCRISCGRLLIKDGLLWIKRMRWPMQSRLREEMMLFKQALDGATLQELQALDGTELTINVFDFEVEGSSRAAWVVTKKEADGSGQFLLPDFGFGGWPEAGIGTYSEFRRKAEQINEAYPWSSKADRGYFRGNPDVGDNGNPARYDLLKQGTQPGAEVWADVASTHFPGPGRPGEPWIDGSGGHPIVLIEDHCKHKYLFHSEGVTYSGRSKYVLGCASAVVTHDLIWTQHYHPALDIDAASPDHNMIQSPGTNFEELGPLMLNLQEQDLLMAKGSSPSRGYVVASNANRTLTNRYLTPASLACYTRGALLAYASILDKSSFNDGKGPQISPGGGIGPTGESSIHDAKEKLRGGDIEVGTWFNVGMPDWPL